MKKMKFDSSKIVDGGIVTMSDYMDRKITKMIDEAEAQIAEMKARRKASQDESTRNVVSQSRL